MITMIAGFTHAVLTVISLVIASQLQGTWVVDHIECRGLDVTDSPTVRLVLPGEITIKANKFTTATAFGVSRDFSIRCGMMKSVYSLDLCADSGEVYRGCFAICSTTMMMSIDLNSGDRADKLTRTGPEESRMLIVWKKKIVAGAK